MGGVRVSAGDYGMGAVGLAAQEWWVGAAQQPMSDSPVGGQSTWTGS